METAETSPLVETDGTARASPTVEPPSLSGEPTWIEPDLQFIRDISTRCGNIYMKCMQCGNCSATCAISPDREPFPRKEMIWAAWGMKDRLMTDPDIWLCYQCNDCSTRCPRGARPGDVLASVRRECIQHYAFPRFLAHLVNQPRLAPLLLGLPIMLLGLALLGRDVIGGALGIVPQTGEKIVYNYSSVFPHWLLNSFFFFFGFLALMACIVGVTRFWRALQAAVPVSSATGPGRRLLPSIGTALKRVLAHHNFDECKEARGRHWSHLCVFFGFVALTLVTIWVITARHNPLIRGEFVYPMAFLNPWKVLANVGGVALLIGCGLMVNDRLREINYRGVNTYFDWSFVLLLALVVLSGFATELLHYLRMVPHRHIVYFGHLVLVFTLLVYMPYSKFAHMIYRTTAIAFAEYSGRDLNSEKSHGTEAER